MKFIIEGGKPLIGEIRVSGAKNAALKMIAASILNKNTSHLFNVPEISDIRTMAKIIEDLGGKVTRRNHSLSINTKYLKKENPSPSLVSALRGSVVLIGPLLSRFNKVKISQPGGDLIGTRPIDTHINAFKKMGVKVKQEKGFYHFQTDGLVGTKVVLDEMSVTATENIMMAASLAYGKTVIKIAASEPEIEDLANFLNKMGAKIKGAGTHTIEIIGVKKLSSAKQKVIPDRIEAGTLAIAAAVTKGKVTIKDIILGHLEMFLNKLKQANVNFEIGNSSLRIFPTTIFNPVFIDTRPYPGFPTDLQAPMAVLLTQAKGTSYIFETLYEGRLNYVKELCKMGAQASILDPHTVVIHGPTPLYGKNIESLDIRSGATLILASLIASGKSLIDKIELVDRGYEKIDERLRKLGANIIRVD